MRVLTYIFLVGPMVATMGIGFTAGIIGEFTGGNPVYFGVFDGDFYFGLWVFYFFATLAAIRLVKKRRAAKAAAEAGAETSKPTTF